MGALAEKRLTAVEGCMSIVNACRESRRHMAKLFEQLDLAEEYRGTMFGAIDAYEASLLWFAGLLVYLAGSEKAAEAERATQTRAGQGRDEPGFGCGGG